VIANNPVFRLDWAAKRGAEILGMLGKAKASAQSADSQGEAWSRSHAA
jgi:hypothetical protein